MPELKPRTSFIITLYNRCKKHRCLPYPGSLLEQPSWLMVLFDAIDAAVEDWKKKKDEEERRQDLLREQDAELRRRIGK